MVDVETERRILFSEASNGLGELLKIAGVLGLDRKRHNGLGDEHRAQCHALAVSECVSRVALDTKQSANFP